jgi:hypothetical protein
MLGGWGLALEDRQPFFLFAALLPFGDLPHRMHKPRYRMASAETNQENNPRKQSKETTCCNLKR